MFGLTFEKILLVGILAAFIIGPSRLPMVAQNLAKWIKKIQVFIAGAKERVQEEMGEEFNEETWKKLDPRQYDPRRIVRDALLSNPDAPKGDYVYQRDPEIASPWDNEAT